MSSQKVIPYTVGLLVSIMAIGAAFYFGDSHDQKALYAARWTSRVGLPIFLVAYLGSSLIRFRKNRYTKGIMRYRRHWGLAFAMTHTIHLVALGYNVLATDETRTIGSLVPGGIAYAMLYVMAFTSNDQAVRALGKNWKRLHSFGIHYLWFIFAASYAGRLFDPELQNIGIFGTIVMLSALFFRLYVRWQSRLQKSTAVAQ